MSAQRLTMQVIRDQHAALGTLGRLCQRAASLLDVQAGAVPVRGDAADLDMPTAAHLCGCTLARRKVV